MRFSQCHWPMTASRNLSHGKSVAFYSSLYAATCFRRAKLHLHQPRESQLLKLQRSLGSRLGVVTTRHCTAIQIEAKPQSLRMYGCLSAKLVPKAVPDILCCHDHSPWHVQQNKGIKVQLHSMVLMLVDLCPFSGSRTVTSHGNKHYEEVTRFHEEWDGV